MLWLLFSVGDVEEALRLEEDVFKERYGVMKPSPETDIVFHCRAGVRSLTAMDTANKLGYFRYANYKKMGILLIWPFLRVKHYVRGYLGWQEYQES